MFEEDTSPVVCVLKELLPLSITFLVLPWIRVPNLACHILSLITKRVRSDWQQRHGHPVAALETFVDLSHFKGTCAFTSAQADPGAIHSFPVK